MSDFEDIGNGLALSCDSDKALRGRLASTGIHDLIEQFLENERKAETSRFDVESVLLEAIALHIVGIRALSGNSEPVDFDILGTRLAMHLKSFSQAIESEL